MSIEQYEGLKRPMVHSTTCNIKKVLLVSVEMSDFYSETVHLIFVYFHACLVSVIENIRLKLE